MFYENIFDKIIVDTIKGKKVKSSFSTDEHNIIGDNIINKYTLIASSYLNNKEITEKDTVNYAEYKGIVNNLDKPKHESRIDKALNIKLSQKEQNILSYYEDNDRHDIINLLNDELFTSAKKITKTIYYPKINTIDILTLEDIFKNNSKEANIFYDIIKSETEIKQSNNDDKIKRLIESKIVIPIVNDFMWINNNNEVYKGSKSEDKCYYIINKINDTIGKLESGDNSIINDMLKYKNAIYYSEYENNDLIENNFFTNNQVLKNNIQFLIDHKQNPYFNLKSKHYFNYYCSNTINTIRNISITEQHNSFVSKNQQVQLRSCNDNINIVGFMIFDGDCDNICYKDLNKINYKSLLDKVNDKLSGNKFTGGYWLFDESDKKRLTLFNDNIDNTLMCKMLTELLFDDVNTIHNKIITDKVKSATSYDEMIRIIKSEIIKMYHNRIKNEFNEDLITIDEYEQRFIKTKIEELENIIYHFLETNNKDLEDKFNKLYGYEDANKLTSVNLVENKHHIDINLTDDKYIENNTVNEYEGLICQHHISWEQINKSNSSNYQSLLTGFISKYVESDIHGKYVCKSCGEPIDIEEYVQEIIKSDGTMVVTNFVAIGRIEDDKKYKDYLGIDGVINNIKNNIIKIAGFVNVNQYATKNKKTENDINQLTKDTIDLIVNTLSLWHNKYTEYNNIKETKYGIKKVLSDLFIWPFDNELFKSDNKHIDMNKINKQNNTMLYLVINMINSLSRDQIINLTKSKDCNYTTYESLIKHLTNIQLQITKDQTTNIHNYPVLGYVIFNFAYNLVRYNRYIDTKGREKNNSLITELTIRAFYTIIDLMNIINLIYFEVKETNKGSDIYNFYQRYYLNFFEHLKNIYSDKSFIETLRYNKTKEDEKVDTNYELINITGKYDDYFNFSKSIIENNKQEYFEQYNVAFNNNNINNKRLMYNDIKFDNSICCNDGKIHKWANYEKGIRCKNCNKTYEELKLTNDLSDKAINEFLQVLGKRYCYTGIKHVFELVKNKRTCKLCGYIEDEIIDTKTLNKLRDNFYKDRILNDDNEEIITDVKIISDVKLLNNEYDLFIKYLKENNDEINEKGVIINFNKITYTIDHNYNGEKIEPYVLSSDQVIEDVLDNKRVLYYKNKNTIVYYDRNTLKLIGTTVNNKFIPYTRHIDCSIIINYDIKEFINRLFMSKNIIDVAYLSREDVFNTYYNNISLFMNNLVKVINKINNSNEKITIDKTDDFNTYLNNKSLVLDEIAASYNGNKKFDIDNKFNELFKLGYTKIIKSITDKNTINPYDNTDKLFGESKFNEFKTFSLIILLKLMNSLLSVDSKISKQIIKLMVYTYITTYLNDNSKELYSFVDELYAPLYVYGDTIEVMDDYVMTDSDSDSSVSSTDEMDIDTFKDVNENGEYVEVSDDENNIIEIDD